MTDVFVMAGLCGTAIVLVLAYEASKPERNLPDAAKEVTLTTLSPRSVRLTTVTKDGARLPSDEPPFRETRPPKTEPQAEPIQEAQPTPPGLPASLPSAPPLNNQLPSLRISRTVLHTASVCERYNMHREQYSRGKHPYWHCVH